MPCFWAGDLLGQGAGPGALLGDVVAGRREALAGGDDPGEGRGLLAAELVERDGRLQERLGVVGEQDLERGVEPAGLVGRRGQLAHRGLHGVDLGLLGREAVLDDREPAVGLGETDASVVVDLGGVTGLPVELVDLHLHLVQGGTGGGCGGPGYGGDERHDRQAGHSKTQAAPVQGRHEGGTPSPQPPTG